MGCLAGVFTLQAFQGKDCLLLHVSQLTIIAVVVLKSTISQIFLMELSKKPSALTNTFLRYIFFAKEGSVSVTKLT